MFFKSVGWNLHMMNFLLIGKYETDKYFHTRL